MDRVSPVITRGEALRAWQRYYRHLPLVQALSACEGFCSLLRHRLEVAGRKKSHTAIARVLGMVYGVHKLCLFDLTHLSRVANSPRNLYTGRAGGGVGEARTSRFHNYP